MTTFDWQEEVTKGPHPLSQDDPALATHALAEAWASIDGKLETFKEEQQKPFVMDDTGTYLGYLAEAQEMIKRLGTRGFKVVPK